jgi:hypothetical protein
MEGILRNISYAIIYIDDLLVRTKTHEDHLQVLEPVLQRLHSHNLKINLDKCLFGNKEVSFLGFTLTPEGIKLGKNKLKAIKDAKPPTDLKTIQSFIGLCKNFLPSHKKTLPSSQHHFYALPEKIQVTKEALFPKKQWMLFAFYKTH